MCYPQCISDVSLMMPGLSGSKIFDNFTSVTNTYLTSYDHTDEEVDKSYIIFKILYIIKYIYILLRYSLAKSNRLNAEMVTENLFVPVQTPIVSMCVYGTMEWETFPFIKGSDLSMLASAAYWTS